MAATMTDIVVPSVESDPEPDPPKLNYLPLDGQTGDSEIQSLCDCKRNLGKLGIRQGHWAKLYGC